MPLHDLQVLFTHLLPRLLDYGKILAAADPRIELVLAEVFRPIETARLYASQGRGSANSLHPLKLAADVLLFHKEQVSGVAVLLTSSEDYRELAEYWKSLHPLCRAGADFRDRPDGNHFSITYQGRR